ncbi:MAG TPA: protein-glutamate O-methyltransferase CheR [Cytophagaceae bacterium]|jgi:chemotaxis protein methyltransferase CheR|nr:protein-glutamate O-methyltransferase CheR [Cytophagaceae bacterium]
MTDISILELKNITQAIREKFGYDFSNYASSSFKRRLLRILDMNKITVETLVERVNNNSFTKEDFLHEITVNVTEMFRDPSFWKALKPLLTAISTSREKIKIWHAGCSSGEEVFSMLIVLKELGILDKVEIVATDIDKSILSRAKEAKITAKNMEVHKHNYERFSGHANIEKYFTQLPGDLYVFDKTMLEKVSFREIDLVKAIPFSKFDLVLCRNVLIYFNNNLQNDVLKLISDCLFEGGMLAIGAKESISWCEVSNKFNSLNAEERIFKKNRS